MVEQNTSAPGCKWIEKKKMFLLWGLVLSFTGSQQAHCDCILAALGEQGERGASYRKEGEGQVSMGVKVN